MATIVTRAGKGSALTHAEVDANFTNINTEVGGKLDASGATFTGKVNTAASSTTNAGLNIGVGTAPTSPVNGDVWGTTSTLQYRLNGVTYTGAVRSHAQTFAGKQTFTPTTANAPVNLGSAAADPTTPVGGDVWATSSAVKFYDGTATKTLVFSDTTAFASATHTHAIADVTDLQTALDGKQTADAELTAISGLSVNGLVTRTSGTTAAARSIAAGTGISVTNGDGVSGNPSVALANTAVAAGTYTLASVTVDAQGRITSASNGAAVASFNTRTGAITLTSSDVTTALTYTPFSTAGGTFTGEVITAPIAGAMVQNNTTASFEVKNNGGTGENNLAMIRFHATGAYGVKLGLRADGFFGLGGWSAATWRWYVNCGNGDMVAAGNVTAYSDETLKDNWHSLPADFVERLAAVKTGTYDRIDTGERQVGVGAQSLSPLLPEAVSEGIDGKLTVAYGNAALAAAVMLARRVIALENKIDELRSA